MQAIYNIIEKHIYLDYILIYEEYKCVNMYAS